MFEQIWLRMKTAVDARSMSMEAHQPVGSTWCKHYLVRSYGLGMQRFHGQCLRQYDVFRSTNRKAPAATIMTPKHTIKRKSPGAQSDNVLEKQTNTHLWS